MPVPRVRRSIRLTEVSASLTRTARGRSGWRRPNASSCRTSAAPRSALPVICDSSSRAPGSATWSSISAELRIAVSRLLKSCAIPPASWPIACNFWPWTSCSCRSISPVTSRSRSTTPDTAPSGSSTGLAWTETVTSPRTSSRARVGATGLPASAGCTAGHTASRTSWANSDAAGAPCGTSRQPRAVSLATSTAPVASATTMPVT